MQTSVFNNPSSIFTFLLKFVINHIIAICAFIIILLLSLPVGFYGMYLYIEPELPTISEIQEPVYKMPIQVYMHDKVLIAEFGDKMSLPVSYKDVPKKMVHALLAAEDDTFFEHEGVSVKGLGRAVTEIMSKSDQQTGGSTITMQVAKNYFLSPDKTLKRKLTEIFLARRIEQNFSKEEILTLYINKIYLGANAYGIKAAAKKYFSRSLDNLSTAQMAMLAGLPKAPSQNNPLTNPEQAMLRRNWIVSRMYSLGYIDEKEKEKALKEDINLAVYKTKADQSFPYLAELARYELVSRYGKSVMDSGWRIRLTIPSKRQKMAESALKTGLDAYGRRHGWHGPEKKLHDKNIRYIRSFDGNYPAKISQVSKRSMQAKLSNGKEIKILWSSTRRYISPNRTGYFSRDARKVFKKNDVIYVKATDSTKKQWKVATLPRVQGALASVDPNSGAIQALAGGYNFHLNKFNRATQSWRQPGSIIKPLIYSLALEKGYRSDSMVSDNALRVGSWKPKNSDGRYYGDITLRRALYLSRNLVSIRLLQSVGIPEARQFLSHFGLSKDKLPSNLTLALGTGGVLPIQMATAYATFANGGHRIQPYFIDSIYNLDGSLVYLASTSHACAKCYNKRLGLVDDKKSATKNKKNIKDSKIPKPKDIVIDTKKTDIGNKKTFVKPTIDNNKPNAIDAGPAQDRLYKFSNIKLAAVQAPRILSPRVTYEMAGILQDVVTIGTGRRARSTGRSDIGGKTGTTNMARDAWFAGFQPTLSTVVWVGYDTPRSLGRREYGGVAALPIWSRYMRQALSGVPTQWVSDKNLSKADKQKIKVIKANLKDINATKDDGLNYHTSFNLPPTAYFIQRNIVTDISVPKLDDIQKSQDALNQYSTNSINILDMGSKSLSTKEIQKDLQYSTQNTIKPLSDNDNLGAQDNNLSSQDENNTKEVYTPAKNFNFQQYEDKSQQLPKLDPVVPDVDPDSSS